MMEILTATSITQGGSGTEFEGRFYVLDRFTLLIENLQYLFNLDDFNVFKININGGNLKWLI